MIAKVKEIIKIFDAEMEDIIRVDFRKVPDIHILPGVLEPIDEKSPVYMTSELLARLIQENRIEYKGDHYYYEGKQRIYKTNLPESWYEVVEIHNLEELQPYLHTENNGTELYFSGNKEGEQ